MGAPYSLRYDEESGFWGLVGPGQSWPCKWFRPAGKERHDAEIAVVELNAAFSAGAAEERAKLESQLSAARARREDAEAALIRLEKAMGVNRPASAKPAAPGSLTEYLKMSDKEKVALLKGKPAPRSSPVCSCRVDALEPNPYCPIHGGERKPAAEKESNDLCGGHGGTMDATPAPAAEKCKHDGGFEDAFGPGLPTGICHLVCTRCGKSAVAIERETRPAPAKGEKA